MDCNEQAFFALVKAGLWEEEARLSQYGVIDFKEIYQLSEEQTVVGLVAAGIEHVQDIQVPKDVLLTFVGCTLQLEQRNAAMNKFIGEIVEKMRHADIYSLLIKGQGIAQCYNRPLWRSAGDVDFLLSDSNYEKASKMLSTMATKVDKEKKYSRHIAMRIDGWEVELHGSLRCGLWKAPDAVLDSIQKSIFYGGNVRSWLNGNYHIFLPRESEDVVYVFSHILQHLYKDGIGLRQICDWCRLVWTYHNKLDLVFLKNSLSQMGVMKEWKTLAYLAVNTLGMPEQAMPFYEYKSCWKTKADKVVKFIFETGNFGHKRDKSYIDNNTAFKRKLITFLRQAKDNIFLMGVFPKNSLKVLLKYFVDGTKAYFNGL